MSNKSKRGARVNLANERLLNDDRIRRIITNNIDKVKRCEKQRGGKNYTQLNLYIDNKFSVWKEYNEKLPKSQRQFYLSAGQLIYYLEHLGYEIDFIITKKDDNTII